MANSFLTLSIALSDNERTRPIAQGRHHPQGVRLIPTVVHPSEMFWRQLKYQDFDVSEMSLSSLLIAASRGDRQWVALPVFTMRSFFHTMIRVHRDSGIRTPQDLRGKRVGVPEYQQTAALWSRGILEQEFDVYAHEIEWFMERGPDRSHGSATGFQPPAGVRLNQIPANTNIGEMLTKGELDATLLYLTSPNLVDRSRADLDAAGLVRPLFSDADAEKRRFYAKTGIYPINHTVVVRRELYEAHPWLALNLYHCFVAAKDEALRQVEETLGAWFDTGQIESAVRAGLKADPKAYGMKAARPVLEMVASFVHEQGLSNRRVGLDEVFAASTLEV
jgi:4,5-dihydroxyphthalate decarboxylase